MGIFDSFKKKQPSNPQSAREIILQLEALGYFKYAHEADLPLLKQEIGNELSQRKYLPFVMTGDDPFRVFDPRHYSLDGEDLFEQNGITDALKMMQPLFEKMNVQMVVSDHFEEYEGEGLNHHITINGKRYIIFDQFEENGWGEVAQRFADIINDQLAIQQSEERIYLICGGNDGRAIFLTEDLFNLMDILIAGDFEKPLMIQHWCVLNQVVYKKIC